MNHRPAQTSEGRREQPIVVGCDAQAGDCVPVRFGAAAAQFTIRGGSGVVVRALRRDDKAVLLAAGAPVGVS
jgi:hypothetical protein